MLEKIREKESKLNWMQNNLLILLFMLLISILVYLNFGIDILVGYNKNLHESIGECIGWIITFTFGELIFVTIMLSALKTIFYKNVSAIQYVLEYKGKPNIPFYFFHSNMPLKEDILTIFILNLLIVILYFFQIDGFVIFLIIYEVLLLFNVVFSSVCNILIEKYNFLFQLSFNEYVEEKTFKDIKKTRTKNDGDYLDFDIQLLYSLLSYIGKHKYVSSEEFENDVKFLNDNVDYIINKNKLEYKCSYYNIDFYLQVIDYQKNFIKQNKKQKEIINKCNKIIKMLDSYINKSKDNWYREKYIFEINYLKEIIKNLN